MGDTITGQEYSVPGFPTVYHCFMQSALQEGVGHLEGLATGATNSKHKLAQSQAAPQCFPRFWSTSYPESRFLCFPHFYFWIWSSGATLRIRALGFGQMLMVLSRVTQPTTPPSLRANCLKPNILGLSWSLACWSIQAWLFKQHF